MGLRPDDVVLATLPLAHSFGLNGALLAPLLTGATVRLVERFVPETVVEVLARDGVTVLPAVATMFRRLLDVPGFKGGPALRLGVSGAAPCPWDLAEAWRARTGVRIVRGYGMTELFRPLSYLAADPTDHPDCVGRPVPGVDVRVVDDEGRTPAGEVGELLIRSPAAMDGYLGSPEETRAVLREGWFHTGDLARLTADGYVAIAGRKRERILRGGYSVFPAEVEAVLLAHPAVAEAAVVPMPHAELGEEVAAFVALRAGATRTPDELIAWCRERLAGFKYPRRVTMLDALPRSATGKILKTRLSESALHAHALGDDALPGRGARGQRRLGGRALAGNRRAAHHAPVPLGVPRTAAVQHAAVVPHDEIPLAPAVLVHGLRARRAREQVVEQAPRLLERHALDVPGVGADVDVLAAVHRVGAHEGLAHGRQLALVLGVEQAPGDRAARVEDAVHDDATLQAPARRPRAACSRRGAC